MNRPGSVGSLNQTSTQLASYRTPFRLHALIVLPHLAVRRPFFSALLKPKIVIVSIAASVGYAAYNIGHILSDIAQSLHRSMHWICLHAGCGTGNYLVALSNYVGRVTGVEYNRGMLEQARAKTSTLQNVTVQEGDATNLPLPELQMDGIVCNQVTLQ